MSLPSVLCVLVGRKVNGPGLKPLFLAVLFASLKAHASTLEVSKTRDRPLPNLSQGGETRRCVDASE